LEKPGGGTGVAYKAKDTKLKRAITLKFLPKELSKDRRPMERLQREACGALDRPIVRTTVHPNSDGPPACCGKPMTPRLSQARDRLGQIVFVAVWRCSTGDRVSI
jgi:serine/threonine protein kinase